VHLPCGEKVQSNRGAEQGDPLGSLFCGLVIAKVVCKVRDRMSNDDQVPEGVSRQFFDAWFMDDGQVVLEPGAVDTFLRLLDEELLAVGATRGTGPDVKSVARLVGSAEAVTECGDDWITERIRMTCQLPGPNTPVHVLGVDIGDDDVRTRQFREATAAVDLIRTGIASLGDSGTEVVLTRRCADVCKVTHLLRSHGPAVDRDALVDFDQRLGRALATALGGSLHDEALEQASLAVQEGGLGMRRAVDVALPAFVAARVTARPLVVRLAGELRGMGFLSDGFEEAFDLPVTAAVRCMTEHLATTRAAAVGDLLDTASQVAAEKVTALAAQRAVPQLQNSQRRLQQAAERLVQAAGGEDPESEPTFGGLQRELCNLLDAERADELCAGLARQHRWTDVRRLTELRDESVSHDWLWALNPAHGPTVPPEDFATCVRIRLGAFLTDEPTLCERCGTEIVERTAAHGLCCASPEGTRGHYLVRDAVLPLVHLADPSATTEVPELIPNAPALRPADIFSESALPGGQAALDIGICSPDATNAGTDCCASMWSRKRGHYSEHLEDMASRGLRYVPLVFSCYGRAHADSAAALELVARQAARRLGVANHEPLLRRARAGIGVAIMRRAAAMARACLPKLGRESLALLFGEAEDEE